MPNRTDYLVPLSLSTGEAAELRDALRLERRAMVPVRELALSWARDVAYWTRVLERYSPDT